MKRVFPLILAFVSITSLSFSQDLKDFKPTESSYKWLVESVQVGQEVQSYSEDNNWIVFHPDGKYQFVINETEKTGEWTFEEETKKINLKESDELSTDLKIDFLDEKKIMFTGSEQGIVYTMKLKR